MNTVRRNSYGTAAGQGPKLPRGPCHHGLRRLVEPPGCGLVKGAAFSLLWVAIAASAGCSMVYDTVGIAPDRAAATRDSLLVALSGERVELVTSDGREVSGVGGSVPPDSFAVLTKGKIYVRLRTEEIVAVRFGGSPHASAAGSLLLGAVGAAVGAAATAGMAGDGLFEKEGAALSGGTAGLLIGGVVGAFVGREVGRGIEYQFVTHNPP